MKESAEFSVAGDVLVNRDTNVTVTDQEETMEYWLSMNHYFGNIAEYREKMAVDERDGNVTSARRNRSIRETCSWIEKRNYKKKLVRRFLSLNPAMDYSEIEGTFCKQGIYINTAQYNDDGYYDPGCQYNFNVYNRIYLTPHGFLRKYHGVISYERIGYALGCKDKSFSKKVNRKIRYRSIDDEKSCAESIYKKYHGIMKRGIW